MKHWVLLLILGMVWGHASNGHCAQKVLDIFQARKPFPIGWLAPGGFQDLETLSSGKQREVLAQLDRAGKKRKFRKQRNLIHLTAGRLEALLNEPLASCHRLKYSIVGNFILEDYRLHFLSQCEIALAEKDSAGDKPNHSLSHLRRALQYKMALFKSYPSSPFSHDLADELARVERLAGKANLESGNLKRAWQTYRKALMRTTAGPPDMAIDATLGLAQVYEKAGNYADAIDLHLFLSRNHPTATVREAASGFVERMEQTTGQTKRALDGLDKLAAWASQAAAPFREFSPRPKTFQNPTVQNFWDVFAAGNLDQVLDAAQAVFAEVPGHREAAGVLPALNRFLTEYLQNHEWPEELDEILAHYPVKALGALGFMLWKQQLVEAAANVYRRILQDHPLETEWCHKAAFFLGRIYEDLKDYPAAQDQYQNLLQRYNQGPYTPMARFKVPWVRRLQGDPGQAAEGFQQIVQNNGEFLGLANGESGGNTRPRLLAAAKFWLARTLRDLGRTEEYEASLHGLVQSNPLSFYGLAARGELQIPFTTLFDKDGNEPEVNRFPGLGEAEKKALARAERLVSVGLHRFARLELERVQSLSDAPGFWFYLSKLWTRSAGHLQAIGLSWKVLAAKDGDKMSPVLAELLFPRPFREKINLHSEKQGLDPLLVLALMRQESAFAPRATSSAQAVGLMQLLPSTAELVASTLGREPPDEERLMEPDENIALGTAYLKGLFDTFQGRAAYALAAYNAGPAKVKQWVELRGDFTPLEFIETIPFNETRDYVKKVLRNYWIYQILTERRAISSIEEFLNFPNPGGPAGQAHSIP